MRALGRRLAATSLLFSAGFLAACDDDEPTGTGRPPQVLGVQAMATSATTVRVTFNSRAGDNSFIVERAQGAAGTSFTQAGTAPAPSTPGPVTFDDTGLTANTDYQYRVIAVRGTAQSDPSTTVAVKTQQIAGQTIEVTQDITTNTTWTKNNTYLLKGFIHVANGATLTIDAGTKVLGDYNTLGSSLFVLRGAKINAVGTATEPIVFTSSQPAGQRKPGDWGGLIIVGNATLSRAGVDIDVEGTGTDNTQPSSGKNHRVTYSGGNTDTDNSGELRYVRVEFAGYAPSLNNELNSFTFAAVGSGTKLSYLQTLAGLDDSFEWFGGTVNADHLVSYDSGDDHFDMSEGFRGRVQHIVGVQTRSYGSGDIRTGAGSASSDPQGIENDGCEGSGCANGRNTTPFTSPVVANFTLVGTGDAATSGSSGGVGMMLRRGTAGYYVNGVLARWPRAAISIRDGETYVRAGSAATQDLATADLAVKNVFIGESAAPFQSGGSSTQNPLDLAGNAITSNTTATASLFTAFPTTVDATTTAAAFDWTPAASSPLASGGLTAFTGKLGTAADAFVTGTSYVGAAEPGGSKWWQGWTVYARN